MFNCRVWVFSGVLEEIKDTVFVVIGITNNWFKDSKV